MRKADARCVIGLNALLKKPPPRHVLDTIFGFDALAARKRHVWNFYSGPCLA
jgi:hypothetical protein